MTNLIMHIISAVTIGISNLPITVAINKVVERQQTIKGRARWSCDSRLFCQVANKNRLPLAKWQIRSKAAHPSWLYSAFLHHVSTFMTALKFRNIKCNTYHFKMNRDDPWKYVSIKLFYPRCSIITVPKQIKSIFEHASARLPSTSTSLLVK